MKRLSLLLIIPLFFACKSGDKESTPNIELNNASMGQLVADTIIYDVTIRNLNPDDQWASQSLQYLNHAVLIDSIFGLIYNQQAEAFEYFENTPLDPITIKDMERQPDFSREKIGKIQFTERWYVDSKNKQLNKEVLSLVLGHELFTDSGEFRGYKPIFRVLLTP